MEPLKPKARQAITKPADEQLLSSLKITRTADRKLTAAAKKLNIGKGDFAGAAIAFFAESGLDPTAERPVGLANVSDKVSIETKAVRVQNADIGNRLISIIRTWEKTLYGFLQVQQTGTLNYLEQIENTIMRHQVDVETSLLSPMLELMVKGNIEAYMGRMIGEKTNLVVRNKPEADWPVTNASLNKERDEQLVSQVRAFLQANSVAAPGRAPKPIVPEAPKPVITANAPAAPPAAPIPPAAV